MKDIYKIAIVGKPNVGKSSLFNRLIGKRKSIIDSKPGLTRDVINEVSYIDEVPVLFLDTGGITKKRHTFIEKITTFTKDTIDKADLVLFVIEVTNIDMDDQYIAEFLRKSYMDKTVLIVNKVDNDEREIMATEVYSLGFKNVFFVSAAHNRGIGVIKSFIKESVKNKNFITVPKEDIAISIIGRPNVGKSSLLNILVGKERSIVSDIPGTTIDTVEEAIVYKGKKLKFVDTAGIRRKAKIEEKLEYVTVKRALRSLENSKIALVLLNSLENITKQDLRLINLAIERKNAVIVVVNKWDLLKGKVDKRPYFERLRFFLGSNSYLPIVEISATEGFNIKKLLDTIISLNDEFHREVQSSKLSDLLVKVTRLTPLFSREGSFKIYYAVQVATAPPYFKAFVNKASLVNESYHRFILKIIRNNLGFKRVPLFLEFKNRR